MKTTGNEVQLSTAPSTVANCTTASLFANSAAQVTVGYSNGSNYAFTVGPGERVLVTKGSQDTLKASTNSAVLAVPVAAGFTK